MAYLAFYRTFRPSSFDTVVRQEHIVRILKNQIESGKIGHAYLFCGPRGTGKTTLAKIFARAINCENPQNASPCGKCPTCKALADGSSLDISEIDAASNNGVDEMRDLREKVQYPPVAGKYKVYIIDEVHMLTASAFNAVLKTLEEPPRHAVFILATTEPQKIPATILSRCMRFDFKLIPQSDLEELIKSVLIKTGKEFEEEAVSAIARAGAGSARDSLSIADMCASYSTGKLTYNDVSAVLGSADFLKIAEICEYILHEDSQNALTAVENILSTGKSVGVLIKDLLTFLNNLAIVKVCRTAREIINLPDETYKKIESIAKDCDGHKLLRVTEILAKAETDLRYSTSGRITLETAVLKCSMPETDYNIDALIGKINELERKLGSGKYSVSAQAVVAPSSVPVAQSSQVTSEPAKPVEQAKPAPKPVLVEEPAAEQPVLWEAVENIAPKGGNLGESDKRAVFGKFIKALRTTHKNAVLFTLCMDLITEFEGEKLVFYTDNESVYKGLNRPDNYKFIGGVLAEFGVTEYEIRLRPKGESDFDKALNELKNNLGNTNIDVK
ncbi:MAG: DNA polymerase III subunit gamma/tau [Clostridiales bacterium]|nr:DNA polymerase III subunit gamma/tau [Clostridiales bacterium]